MLNERNTLLEDDGIEEEILVEEECSVAQAVWGDIQGNIENQTDLQNALDAKQDSLTETQLNAVNSGITSEKVTTYDGYADQIASKADQSTLNAESVARGEADTALGTRIDNEALARQQADNGLQTQIDAITSKSDVVDVVANYAALQAYDTSVLGNNDVIKVLDDETHEDALTYYRWSTTTQTWTYIGQEAPYYSKGQMDVKLAEKQDKLTAGANIQIQNGTISATDTTYTAGNGLNLNGTEFSADTTMLATKEDLEGYYTKPETDTLLAPKLEAEVVAELPTAGEEGKLYLTPKAHTTQTATGNPITATVAEEAGALESFQLDGDTFQQTYTGKNLVDTFRFENYNLNGVELRIEADGSIVLNGTSTASGSIRADVTDIFENRVGEQLTYSVETSGTGLFSNFGLKTPNASISGNVTPAAPTRTVALGESSTGKYFADVYFDGSKTFDNFVMKIQIEAGSTATSYEPYVGGTPSPNPNYPQAIQTVTGLQTVEIQGKNLYNFLSRGLNHGLTTTYDTTTGEIAVTGTATAIYSDIAIPVNLALEPGQTFTSSIDRELPVRAVTRVTYTDNTMAGFNIEPGQTSVTWSPAKQVQEIRLYLSLFNAGDSYDLSFRFQIELGSTATSYAPYRHQALPLDLGNIELCKLGTYQDYIYKDGDTWKVHKAMSKFVFTNAITSGLSKQNLGFVYNISGNPLVGKHIPLVGKCSHFDVEPTTTTWTALNKTGMNSVGALWFRTTDTNFGDARTSDEFAQWLVDAGVSFVYALETPTDTIITDQNLIAQLEAIRTASLQNGANTITNTATGSNLAGDMEIGYYGYNPTNRYDKFIWLDINNEYEQIGS